MTGGSGGIGYEVARALALAKARVLVAARKADNAEQAIEKMKSSAPGAENIDVKFVQCDLGNLKDVKNVADNVAGQEERMDLVRVQASVIVLDVG